ncbi:MAG: hypothetical protein R3F60_14150 [bacterium]
MGAERMYTAPGWYAADEEGRLWLYRQTVSAFRHDRARVAILAGEPVDDAGAGAVGSGASGPYTPVPSACRRRAGATCTTSSPWRKFRGDAVTLVELLRTYGP